tara:strand:+ start:8802 stop:9518 length:717 start_codon:yes stop_codon:yes gene_type:complete
MPGTSKSYSVLGRNFYRTPTGENLYMGRKNRTQNSNSNSSQSPSFNSGGGSAMGSGGGSSPAQIPSLLGDGGGIDYNAGPKDLQSSAATGNISGGTRAERKEARREREPGSGPIDTMAVVGAGIGAAGAVISELDTDDKYGGMDVASSTLKYAAMGAVAGPWGAAAGAVVGLGVGLVKKNKFEKKAKKDRKNKIAKQSTETNQAAAGNESDRFNAGQQAASQGAYGSGDVDNFITKYS